MSVATWENVLPNMSLNPEMALVTADLQQLIELGTLFCGEPGVIPHSGETRVDRERLKRFGFGTKF